MEEYRFQCPCGTTFSTIYNEPICPECGQKIKVVYKHRRKPTAERPETQETRNDD
jgi:rRNA maturation endonuclease Nob1